MTEPARRQPHLRLVDEEDDLDDVLLSDDDVAAALARAEELRKQPASRSSKRRQFIRFDATWAEGLLAASPTVSAAGWRIAMAILAKADFYRQFLITDTMMTAAGVTVARKRVTLERLEQLGLIQVEWRGRGRAPFVTPLHLSGRSHRK